MYMLMFVLTVIYAVSFQVYKGVNFPSGKYLRLCWSGNFLVVDGVGCMQLLHPHSEFFWLFCTLEIHVHFDL